MEHEELSLDYYEIYTDKGGEKWINFNGSVYESEDDEYEGDDWENEALYCRHTEISGGCFELKQFLEDLKTEHITTIIANSTWYTEDITYPKASDIVEEIKNNGKFLSYSDITMDTPDGEYWNLGA